MDREQVNHHAIASPSGTPGRTRDTLQKLSNAASLAARGSPTERIPLRAGRSMARVCRVRERKKDRVNGSRVPARAVEDLELERAVFLSILGIARRLVSRYEPLEALVDEVPYGCLDCGMQVVDGEGASSGPSSSRPRTQLSSPSRRREEEDYVESRVVSSHHNSWWQSQRPAAPLLRQPSRLRDPPGEGAPACRLSSIR